MDYRQKTFDTLTAAGYTNYREHRIDGEVVGWTFYDIPVNLIRIVANGVIKIKVPRKDRQTVATTPAAANFFKRQRKLAAQATLDG